ncbi:hypothetical protein, partial [Salmonella sp. SAL4456]|uniref:hypothetical protein n=1 Tax=Salmonella sp. SAL4456 TaxID=3159911 RepID=UPI00397B66E1
MKHPATECEDDSQIMLTKETYILLGRVNTPIDLDHKKADYENFFRITQIEKWTLPFSTDLIDRIMFNKSCYSSG